MASQTATCAPSRNPQVVSGCFVAQYYEAVSSRPNDVHKFYKVSSSISRPESSEALASVTTIQGHEAAITDLVLSLDYYKDCVTKIVSIDSQLSLDEGVVILVSAYLILQNKVEMKFFQTFFLASEGNGKYFVLNDIFRFVDETPTEEHNQLLAGSTNDVLQALHIPDQDPSEEACVRQKQRGTTIQPLVRESQNGDEIQCISQKEDAVGEKGSFITSVEPSITQSISKVTPSSEPENFPKKSFASMVEEKVGPSAAPPIAPATKARPAVSGTRKVVNRLKKPLDALNEATPTTNVLMADSHSVTTKETSRDEEGYSVFIRNLPWSVIADQVEIEFKKFGPIIPCGVQVRRNKFEHYCFAFVEFESKASVQAALEASPVIVEGHQADVVEKRIKKQVRNGVAISSGGWKDRYPGNGGYRNDNKGGNECTDLNLCIQNDDGRTVQQFFIQNDDGKTIQQRLIQNGDGRTEERPVENGDGRMARSGEKYQHNRSKQ